VNQTLPPCPECAHEWSAAAEPAAVDAPKAIKDAVGNVLADGDTGPMQLKSSVVKKI
jgi:uncharacterized Zn ribbon protein